MNKPAFDDLPEDFEPKDDFLTAPLQKWDSAEDLVTPPSDDFSVGPMDDFAIAPLDDFGPSSLDEDGADLARQIIDEPAPAPAAEAPGFGFSDAGDLAVPAIAIHFFYERPETLAAIQLTTADRRMQRASVQILPGGLAGAYDHYQGQPTPSLIVVESAGSSSTLLEGLDRLAEACDPGTKVVVIGATNDIALYRQLVKRGVSEYLVPPVQPLPLIQAITTLYSDPSAPFVGRTIAFVGAKGGVGASVLAHNFGYCLTEFLQVNGVIVDFDLPFGTAGLDFNQDPLQGVADALSRPDRLDPVLLDRMMARCSERLSLFAAPATLDSDYEISSEAFEEVANKIRTTAPFVILDLPHLWSPWMRKVLLGADEVVLVATPDLASLRNAKNMVDLISSHRPNDQPPRLVLNQVGVPGRPEIPVKDFAEAMGLQPSLIMPFDPKLFGAAANNGQMLFEVQAKSKSAEALSQFVQMITRREQPKASKRSLLAGLLKGR